MCVCKKGKERALTIQSPVLLILLTLNENGTQNAREINFTLFRSFVR